MILLTNLTAEAGEATWVEPRGILQSVHDEPVTGFFRNATLGAAGVVLKRGDRSVGIPLAELFKLAEAADPAFVPPSAAVQPE